MPKIPFFDESYRLWLHLFQTRSALFKARQNKVGKYVHYNMAAALVTIWACEGKTTPAVLSRRLFLKPHTTSELVKRMDQKGLIKKNKDGKRENIIRISITEKGRKFCLHTIQPEFVHTIIDVLSDEQKTQLSIILRILYIQALKELGFNEDDMRPQE